MNELEKHYNKFNEDKRLLRRHGQVEYTISMRFIHDILDSDRIRRSDILDECEIIDKQESVSGADSEIKTDSAAIKTNSQIKIADIGAGTGRYSIPLSEEGYDVTALEYVQHNLGILKSKGSNVKAYKGDARKLKRFADEEFDLTILFGPMYHLYTEEDKLKALNEAKRVTRPGGVIMVAYLMNEYAVIMHGLKDGELNKCLEDGRLDADYHCHSKEEDLYEYVRLEDVYRLTEQVGGLKRITTFAPDGPSDYIRPVLNAMDEETFKNFIEYQWAVCERKELLGASSHIVDVLVKM